MKLRGSGVTKPAKVIDMVKAYSAACGHEIKYKLADRRPGDVAVCYGDASLALKELGWKAELGMEEMR